MKKTHALTWLACAALTASTAIAQGPQETPPAPPPDAQPPGGGAPLPPPPPPGMQPGHDQDRTSLIREHHHPAPPAPRGPVTFLGVGVEPLPPAAAEHSGLPPGFGLMVNFVVPGGAAEGAGLKPHDILKTLNDQILVDPEQLAVLVRSFNENQEVTLGVLRDGKETKLTAKLQKHQPEVAEAPRPPHPRFFAKEDNDEADEADEKAAPPPPIPPVREILRELEPLIKDQQERARNVIREQREATREAADQARQANEKVDQIQREITILREQNGASRSTKLDLGHARIMIQDERGETELKADNGKRFLTVKDADGKVLFSGPVDTPEQRQALSPDVRSRLEKLERDESLQLDTHGKDHPAQPPKDNGTT